METKIRVRLILAASLILFALGLSILTAVSSERYMLISIVFVFIAMIPFFAKFEQRRSHAKTIVILAILVAIAALSRVPFALIPSVQPTTFVVMMTGLAFGAEAGFLVGALAALLSNLMLGQGPWTPWQMFGWGMIGCTAGLLRNVWWMKKIGGRIAFGVVWGILFGWIMNIVTVISIFSEFSWELFASVYAASVLFDMMHAICNGMLILLFSASWINILQRFRTKYGMV